MEHQHTRGANIYAVIGILIISVFLIFNSLKGPAGGVKDGADIVKGTVLQIISEKEIDIEDTAYAGAGVLQELLIEIKRNGSKENINITNSFAPVKVGEKVFLQKFATTEDASPNENSFLVVEISRTRGIFWLAIFFVVLSVVVSGKKGFNSLVGLTFSLAIILSFIVPRILDGENAIITTLIGSVLILVVALYTSHGMNKKSFSALAGISITLLFVGLFATYVANALHFSGVSSEEAAYLVQETANKINFVGLLIAGVIIAALGVLDDIAITQASTVFTLHSTDSKLSGLELFKKAMGVGRDHISAVINTLVLAYTGASLPLVLLFSIGSRQTDFVLSNESIAEEIARTLVSTSGLVLAVPITTLIAVFLAKKSLRD